MGDGATPNRQRGEVKFFRDDLGYGFIVCEDGTDLFVHWTGIEGDGTSHRTLVQGQTVAYVVADGRKGPQAEHVEVIR